MPDWPGTVPEIAMILFPTADAVMVALIVCLILRDLAVVLPPRLRRTPL